MGKKLLLLGLIALIIGGAYAIWMFYKPHENVAAKKPFAAYKAESLIIEFDNDHEETDAILTGKVITLEGLVSKIDITDVQTVLSMDYDHNFIIQAYLPDNETEIQTGDYVKLKGKYAGYVINDENYMIPADIKLEPCYIIK